MDKAKVRSLITLKKFTFMFCQKTVRNQCECYSSWYRKNSASLFFLFTFFLCPGMQDSIHAIHFSHMLHPELPSHPHCPQPQCRLSSLTLGGTVYSWMNLGLSLLDSSSANGQEKPAEPVQQFQTINKQSKGNGGRYYFMTSVIVFSPKVVNTPGWAVAWESCSLLRQVCWLACK